MDHSQRTLLSGFIHSVDRFARRPALELDGRRLDYAELSGMAASIAATLDRSAEASPPLTAVFGRRTVTSYAGVLGALGRGHAYVPLNPSFPVDRTRRMLERSTCRAVIVDEVAAPQIVEVLEGRAPGMTVLVPDCEDVTELQAALPGHRVLGARDLVPGESLSVGEAEPDGIAYLLFTSGSTGDPKGVVVAHRNATHFINVMAERYAVTEDDRFSQTFDLTFDLSVFDMFLAWECGACVCAPTQQQKMLPGKYVRSAEITVWFSVPSTAVLMNRLRMLKPDAFPRLRLSLFCGEALTVDVTESWVRAAPNSVLENLYGPTELTIACALYRWDPTRSPSECEQGVVPIGSPYPGMIVLVADEEGNEVEPGATGELLMAGPQLTLGYWQDPDRTAAAFIKPPGRQELYYRTGDRVRRPVRPEEPLVYLGRLDNQIKIQGYRVELGEVESVLRRSPQVDAAVAIGWPETASGADGIVGFVAGADANMGAVLETVRSSLPSYMQLSRLVELRVFPLNSNGKIDRGALKALLLDDA